MMGTENRSEGEKAMADPRYSRQTGLPFIGEEGQEKLAGSRAAVIGAGGLGSTVIYYLAAAGVGNISIIDADSVELSNLNRQIIHRTADIGRMKAESACEKALALNPAINVKAVTRRLDEDNAGEILEGHDIVVDCVDSFMSRDTVNRACVKLGIPLIEAGVTALEGFIMKIVPGRTACFRCAYPEIYKPKTPPQVLGAAAGMMGAMEAAEAIKHLVGAESRLEGRMAYISLTSTEMILVELAKNPACPVCG
jgi:molybdopterin-synthase adenylyltransferase